MSNNRNSGIRKNALFDEPTATQEAIPVRSVSPKPNSSFPQFQPDPSTTTNNPSASWFSSEFGAATNGGQQTELNLFENPAANFMIGVGMDKLYGSGSQIVNTGIGKYFSFLDGLRSYFNVDNKYVLQKILILLFPLRHSSWERKNRQSFATDAFATNTMDSVDSSLQFQREINDPDLYIPMMAFITYVLLVGFLMGYDNTFTPDMLASVATKAFLITLLEVGIIKLGFYILQVPSSLAVLDILSYSGYKYVGIVVSLLASILFGSYAYYSVTLLLGLFMAMFMIRTLRRTAVHADDMSSRVNLDGNTQKRNYFIFIIAVLQLPLMFFLSYAYARQVVFFGALFGTSAAAAATKLPPAHAQQAPAQQQQQQAPQEEAKPAAPEQQEAAPPQIQQEAPVKREKPPMKKPRVK